MPIQLGRLIRARERAVAIRTMLEQRVAFRDLWFPDFPISDHPGLAVVMGEIWMGHFQGRPHTLTTLSQKCKMARNTVRDRVEVLLDVGVIRVDGHYYALNEEGANSPERLQKWKYIVGGLVESGQMICAAVNDDTIEMESWRQPSKSDESAVGKLKIPA